MTIRPIELGCAGHLIVASRCRWKRHTQVGDYRVSSIGNYFPDHKGGERECIGGPIERPMFFETLVFETTGEPDEGNDGCGCRAIKSWSEIDGERYETTGEAQAGHERYVKKYLAMAKAAKVHSA